MSKFYSAVFCRQTQPLGPEMGNYAVVQTTETGKNNFPKEPGRINGGFFQRTREDQVPSVVIAVDDIRVAMKQVAEAGGTVLGGQKPGQPDDIPGIGLYAAIIDTEGNRVGMLQPAPRPLWRGDDDQDKPTVRGPVHSGAIRKALPGAEEVISYEIPAFRMPNGLMLWFAGWKRHYSLYPATGLLVEAFKEELAPYEIARGTIHFPFSEPVPVKLITRIAKFRAREAAGRKRLGHR